MSNFRKIFTRQNTFLAVIHVEEVVQALRNVAIAHDNGADGVFLINHRISASSLSECYREVRNVYPDFWVGLNFLDLDNKEAVAASKQLSASGLWIDDAGINESSRYPFTGAMHLHEWQITCDAEDIIIFGGVAFKYQKPVKDVSLVASLAVPYVDVITTSGSGTGIAADLEKIKSMKKAIDDHPLAIASGITPENIEQYIPFTDCFLVATGVSNSHTELDPTRVRNLAKIISR